MGFVAIDQEPTADGYQKGQIWNRQDRERGGRFWSFKLVLPSPVSLPSLDPVAQRIFTPVTGLILTNIRPIAVRPFFMNSIVGQWLSTGGADLTYQQIESTAPGGFDPILPETINTYEYLKVGDDPDGYTVNYGHYRSPTINGKRVYRYRYELSDVQRVAREEDRRYAVFTFAYPFYMPGAISTVSPYQASWSFQETRVERSYGTKWGYGRGLQEVVGVEDSSTFLRGGTRRAHFAETPVFSALFGGWPIDDDYLNQANYPYWISTRAILFDIAQNSLLELLPTLAEEPQALPPIVPNYVFPQPTLIRS